MAREVIERVLKIAVGVFLKIAQDARIELLFIQRRLQVDGQAVFVLRKVAHVRARRQHQRTRHAKVREEHLTQVGIDDLILLIVDRERHVAQRKALHLGAPGIVRFQWDERWTRGRDRVAKLPGKPIPVAGRTGERIGQTARADDGSIAVDGTLRGHNGRDRTIVCQNIRRRGVHDPTACVRIGALKGVGNIVRPVGDRKHAVAALGLERHAERFKQRHRILRAKTVERTVEKAPVARDVGKNGLGIAVIRHVAAALAGDAQLFAEHLVRLEQHNIQPPRRRRERAHGPGRTAADHNYISFQRSHTPRILSRRSPARGTSQTCAPGRAHRRP